MKGFWKRGRFWNVDALSAFLEAKSILGSLKREKSAQEIQNAYGRVSEGLHKINVER